MKKILLLLILAATVTFAQSKDVNKLLDAVKNKFNQIKDYQADVVVKVDMDFIKVPDSKAKVYFKQPDKTKMESEGFAMLPKQSTKFSPMELLKGNFTSVYVKSETIDNRKLDVVKIIPNSDSSDVVLTTLWIDAGYSYIKKIETMSKRGGAVAVGFTYNDTSIALPSKLVFSFNLGEVNMPPDVSGPGKKGERKRGRDEATKIKGSVIMTYSNYKINKGLPDSLFEEKKK